jgi:glycerate 2-kinase
LPPPILYTVDMRIVIAPDKFKGSLSAREVAGAMVEGVKLYDPSIETVVCPMADGGDGTIDAIAAATGARINEKRVRGPLEGQEVTAKWACLERGIATGSAGIARSDVPTAVIEMAQASGYSLVPPDRRDPMTTTTFGTGELILDALDAGCAQVIVGIGGSGTVDGGTGMASALGCRFLDAAGKPLEGRGGTLASIARVDASGCDPRVGPTEFLVASDVNNPLTGKEGAAAVFGPQKGATPSQVEELDRGLANLGVVVERDIGIDVRALAGGGAAGGLGAGLAAFCGARIASGVDLVAEVVGLADLIKGADLVLTGEGSYDDQTARGKTPAGVARIAAEQGVPAVILAGRIQPGAETAGVPVFCVLPGPMGLDEAMRDAHRHVVSGTGRLMRLLGRSCAP